MKGSCYLIVPIVVSADLATKAWAEQLFGGVKTLVRGLLTLRLMHNPGFLLFSGQGSTPLWVWGLVSAALLPLLVLAWRSESKKTMRHLGLACMIGGALGNLAGRALYGYVVDFIELRGLPVMNLADAALLLGTLLVVIDLARKQPPMRT